MSTLSIYCLVSHWKPDVSKLTLSNYYRFSLLFVETTLWLRHESEFPKWPQPCFPAVDPHSALLVVVVLKLPRQGLCLCGFHFLVRASPRHQACSVTQVFSKRSSSLWAVKAIIPWLSFKFFPNLQLAELSWCNSTWHRLNPQHMFTDRNCSKKLWLKSPGNRLPKWMSWSFWKDWRRDDRDRREPKWCVLMCACVHVWKVWPKSGTK